MLANKSIVLGVTGGIAAYKVADLASRLTKAGAIVDTIMTESAQKFVAPLTFQALTQRPVVTDMFRLLSETNIAHVALAKRADVVLIAPATANVIAKLACGIADDMLSTTVLATKAPVVVAPAMETNMYENPATQENIARLKGRGVTFVDPAYGRLASGAVGQGRLAELDEIEVAVRKVLGRLGDLAGKKVVVTAGGTQEPIDPVRFIGNRSSGKMGFALAEAARDRGAAVVLVAAPTYVPLPAGVSVVQVQTAVEMKRAVEEAVAGADILVMAAAVADYRVNRAADHKIKRENQPGLSVELVRNPDILGELPPGGRLFKVGFAAESDDLIANARSKLERKRLQLIAANQITSAESAFGSETNRVTLIDSSGALTELPVLPKREVADRIFDKVVESQKA
ncbi:MAG: bifunctional phosphopantothenoylcysteine decarboxylase/phosphopantothenate--cysteine ligase CoaBC [Chloroflexi bacterium]|nr:bifunctional phosphopantothenoylcysteine decarboxylase/phosphopantothenate--cysteine ligase CoaBC [Chloroflexota bacterium]